MGNPAPAERLQHLSWCPGAKGRRRSRFEITSEGGAGGLRPPHPSGEALTGGAGGPYGPNRQFLSAILSRTTGGLVGGEYRPVSAAGVSGRVSGHSLRVGSAQSLAADGAGLVELQEAGDWQAPTHASALRTAPARSTRRRRQAPLPGGPR